MPELPEVETVCRYLRPHLKGRRITGVDVLLERLLKNRSAEDFAASLTGCTFTEVTRRGKYILLHLDAPWLLLVHLRMTGRLIYEDDTAKELPRFTRLVFHLDQGRLVYGDVRTFGCLWLVPESGKTGIRGFDSLGPDALAATFSADYLYAKLHASKRPVKTMLLDQNCVAGLGNIYVDEALYQAGILPTRPCNAISRTETAKLHAAIQNVLQEGLAFGGTTVFNFVDGSGKEGKNQENLKVYGKEGTPCPVCGAEIRYTKLGGRGTHYCPICQK